MFKLFSRDRVSGPVGQGTLAGVAEALYIALVAVFMASTQVLFATPTVFSAIFGIVAFLLLFVMSVAISGFLVFGWPAYYFLEKKYREAMFAFAGTVGTMFVIFAGIFIAVAIASLI
jgi:hypothetical protein